MTGPVRKSRLKAAFTATSRGKLPTFRPDEAQWSTIEQKYGDRLGQALRASVVNATERLLQWSAFENAAAPAAVTLNEAKRVERAALELEAAILGIDSSSASGGAIIKIEQRFGGIDRLRRFREDLSALIGTCRCAASEAETGEGLDRGSAWNQWVNSIGISLERHRLPVGVSKDGERISPFVRLVRALQSLLPSSARRHTSSDQALAQGIWNGRRQLKRDAACPIINQWQFYQQLAIQGLITEDDALAAMRGKIPARMLEIVGTLPADQQLGVEKLLAGDLQFDRSSSAVDVFAKAVDWSSEDADAFWKAAGEL